MGFGMTYELAIVLFVVVFGLLFIVLQYSFLLRPFIELTVFFGIVLMIAGFVKKNYDTLFSGILFFVVALSMISVMPSIIPVYPGGGQTLMLNVLWPLLAPMTVAYAFGPLALGILLILFAWVLSRAK